MLRILQKEFQAHKAFVLTYIAVCVFCAFFFGQFMSASMPTHVSATAGETELLPEGEMLVTLNNAVLGDSFKNLAGNYSGIIGISAEPFTGLLFLGIMQNINKLSGNPMNMPAIPVGHPAVLAVVAVCFVASKFMKANSATKVFGICTLGYLEKFLGTFCVIAIGVLSVIGVAGTMGAATVQAAGLAETAGAAKDVATGVISTVFAVFMAIMSLIVNYIVKTVMMGLDALESMTPSIVDVVIEVVKTLLVLALFIINVVYPPLGYALNILIFIICCLIFKACYNAAEYLKNIYIFPFIKGIFGYKDDYPLIKKHIPGRVKRKFKDRLEEIMFVIPVYTIKKPAKWGLKLKLYERVWFVKVGEETGLLFRKKDRERNYFMVLSSSEDRPVYLRKGFRFFELYTRKQDPKNPEKLLKRKEMSYVFTREYRYRFEDMIELTGFVNVNEENLTRKQLRKQERKEQFEQMKESVSGWFKNVFGSRVPVDAGPDVSK